jgi:hypothetical protein
VGTVNVGSRAPASLSFIWRCARGGPLPQNGRRPRSEGVSDRESDSEIIPGDHIPTRSSTRARVEVMDYSGGVPWFPP